jgi:hypothetical protein
MFSGMNCVGKLGTACNIIKNNNNNVNTTRCTVKIPHGKEIFRKYVRLNNKLYSERYTFSRFKQQSLTFTEYNDLLWY